MERFKITCEISHKQVELQFDIKKMPGEIGPCYMISVDGLFRSYVTKESGKFIQLMNSTFSENDMVRINELLENLKA